MIFLSCAAVTLVGALFATISSDGRRATLALWVAGLGAGGLYLTMGAELLAIVQWVVSTLLAISFIFYAVMFGELKNQKTSLTKDLVIQNIPAGLAGAAFALLVFASARHLPMGRDFALSLGAVQNMAALGESIVRDHLLSLEVLGITLAMVLIGAGVIARPERGDR